MSKPFDPHPNWRRNFEFTAAYAPVNNDYTLDPTIDSNPKSTLEFKLDPIIHKFTSTSTQVL